MKDVMLRTDLSAILSATGRVMCRNYATRTTTTTICACVRMSWEEHVCCFLRIEMSKKRNSLPL